MVKKLHLSYSFLALLCIAAPISNSSAEEKLLRSAVAVDTQTPPATTFTSDVPKLYAFYIGNGLKPGDKLRGVWIAEDVGAAAPKNSKIDEATIVVATPTDQGAFSLSKPTAGWPVGSYKVDIYDNENLVETTKFTITKAGDAAAAKPGAKVEETDDASDEGDDDGEE